MPAPTAARRPKRRGYQQVNASSNTLTSWHRRFSAASARCGGNIRPIGLDEAAAIDAQPRHLLAQRPPRDVQPFHDGIDLASGLFKATLDDGTLEGLDLLGQGKSFALHGRTTRHEAL